MYNKKMPYSNIYSQLMKRNTANWGNKTQPTEETKHSQLRKYKKKLYLCIRIINIRKYGIQT